MDSGDDSPETEVLPWWQSPLNLFLAAMILVMVAAWGGVALGRSDSPVAHNSVDTGFLQDMRIHHEQAVVMSMVYLDVAPAGHPVLRMIAREIVVDQSTEAGRMVQLLRMFNEAETNESEQAMAWMGEPIDLDRMPGLASDDEMQSLYRSRGAEADRMFALMMIAHHQGGLHMARHALDHARNSEVVKMAAAIVKSQSGEIGELKRILGK